MDISKNTTYSQRYDINHIIDVGFQNTIDVGCFKNHQQVTGVRGYHGRFENIIGWILENILHKAVSVKDQKGNKYYLNCNSLIKWADRVKKQGYVIDPNFSSFVRDSKLVQTALESIKEPTQKKKTFDNQEHPEKDHLKNSAQSVQNKPLENLQRESPKNSPETLQELPKHQSQEERQEIHQNPPLRNEEDLPRESSDNSSIESLQEDKEANLKAAASNLDHITEENLSDFDFSTMILSKDSVNTLLERIGIIHFQTISKENLALLIPYFSETHLKWLSNKQVNEFDFSKVNLEKDRMQAMIDILFNPIKDDAEKSSKAAQRIPQLSEEQLYTLAPFFASKNLWSFVNDDQVKMLDFVALKNKLQPDQYKIMLFSLFDMKKRSDDNDRILSLDQGLAKFIMDEILAIIRQKYTA